MKIQDAKRAYSAQLDVLWNKKRTLSKLLKDQESGGATVQAFDRVEISRELSAVDAQYKAVRSIMDGITETETMIHNSEAAKQQSEAVAKQAEELGKIMEVYRRIACGDKVPPSDEKKLMEYSHEMYMAAKSAAMLAQREGEEHDSLWEDEKDTKGEEKSAGEIAAETEISVSAPDTAAAEAVQDIQE